MKNRIDNFEYLMRILDEAEGVRDTEQGAFSFLREDSYVRRVVVTPGTKTGIAGLKTFLATEVLEIFSANNKSKVSYKNIQAQLSCNTSKKYSFSYEVLDEVFDVEKNKEAMLENCWMMPENTDIQEWLKDTDTWLPYLLLERLRKVVWKKLRAFDKLCEQTTDSENPKKVEVYFQFIQAVALYEIFLVECILEQGNGYVENAMLLVKEMQAEVEQIAIRGVELEGDTAGQEEALISAIKEVLSEMETITNKHVEALLPMLSRSVIFKVLTADFGISYTAICCLLMVFEAMNVCDVKMRGIKKSSLMIMDELAEVYGKNLEILQNHNKNRVKRYRKVNELLEELLERYGDKEYDVPLLIVTFMEELRKPTKNRDMMLIHNLECKLGRPVYCDLGGEC